MKTGRDFLGGFGPDHNSPQRPRATSGGVTKAKDLPYSPPVGPINNTSGPGIGDVEPRYGMAGERLGESGEREFTGSPGNHGTNHGNKGSQGRH